MIVASTVLEQNHQSQRHSFQGPGAAGVNSSSSNNDNPQSKRTRKAIVQCLLYGVTFVNTTLWAQLNFWLMRAGIIHPQSKDDSHDFFWIQALAILFLPLQGFFSFLIFIRLRYLSTREKHPTNGRWFAFRESIWNPKALVSNRRSSTMTSSRRILFGNNTSGNGERRRLSSGNISDSFRRLFGNSNSANISSNIGSSQQHQSSSVENDAFEIPPQTQLVNKDLEEENETTGINTELSSSIHDPTPSQQ